jgi:LysM repeat protein
LPSFCDDSYHQQNRRTEFKVVSGGSNVKVNDNKRVPVINDPNSRTGASNANLKPSNTTSNNLNQSSQNTYVVKSGDNLYSISKTTGVPVRKLIQLNNIENDDLIKEGQRLKLK